MSWLGWWIFATSVSISWLWTNVFYHLYVRKLKQDRLLEPMTNVVGDVAMPQCKPYEWSSRILGIHLCFFLVYMIGISRLSNTIIVEMVGMILLSAVLNQVFIQWVYRKHLDARPVHHMVQAAVISCSVETVKK